MTVEYRPLDSTTVADIPCAPGGLEVRGSALLGEIERVADWRRERLSEGLRGLVAYVDGAPRGFAEYLPADVAPFPIEAPGAVVLSCYHWAGGSPEGPAHLEREREMLARLMLGASGTATGMAALAWDHPIHFPISLLRGLEFREIARDRHLALMWHPFRRAEAPRWIPAEYEPRAGTVGRLVIDAAYSTRCPYSIDQATRLRRIVEDHPQRARIDLRVVQIDTRDEAIRHGVSPWDWGWLFMDGEPIELFGPGSVSLSEEIARRLPASESTAGDTR